MYYNDIFHPAQAVLQNNEDTLGSAYDSGPEDMFGIPGQDVALDEYVDGSYGEGFSGQ